MKMRKTKTNTIKIVLIAILSLMILGLLGSFLIIKNGLKTTEYYNNQSIVSFSVDKGSTGKETIQKLKEENIIKNDTIVYYYARIFAKANFISGNFNIPGNLDIDGILNYLSNDSNVVLNTVRITLPEGLFAFEMADIISNSLLVSSDELMSLWNDEDYIRSIMSDYPFLTEEIFNPDIKVILEGYLFPSTYDFYVDASADEITRKILDTTLDVYMRYIDNFKNAPIFYHYNEDEYIQETIHEVFTLASILQWESGASSEMDLIASVFYNRLNEPEILGSTVTACYSAGLDKQACAIVGDNFEYTQREDGYTYNTYTMEGLPIGPVLSPGLDAILAVLNPAESDYFYFVGDTCEGTGTKFASTWSEHEYNIEKYVNCSID